MGVEYFREGSSGAVTGNGCAENFRVTAGWFGTGENWELEELQSPGRRSRKGGREKQKRVRIKNN